MTPIVLRPSPGTTLTDDLNGLTTTTDDLTPGTAHDPGLITRGHYVYPTTRTETVNGRAHTVYLAHTLDTAPTAYPYDTEPTARCFSCDHHIAHHNEHSGCTFLPLATVNDRIIACPCTIRWEPRP